MKWLRYFDLTYWQMREALGFPIPSWVDRRWPRKFAGNAGTNPFQCGTCAAYRLSPVVHITNAIEQLAQEEYRPGVSAGAAARQLCRSLRDIAPTLKAMLEKMLADGNVRSHDRRMILEAFRNAAPGAAALAASESYRRLNPDCGLAQAQQPPSGSA